MADSAGSGTVAMADIVGEGGLLAGGGRAILLQVAHPGVGRGVAEHSDFAYRQVDRLRTTMTYVYGITFGSLKEQELISHAVTAVHRKVNGPGYDALDPELQLWVAATLYDTAILLYERWFGPLDPDVAESVYQQYRVLGTALQVPADLWPADRAEFGAYWQDVISTIEVSEYGRQVCRDLLHPRKLTPLLRPVMPLNRLVTAGLLPESMRRQYGMSWNAVRQGRFEMFMTAMTAAYPRVPRVVRELPKTYYLRDMRRRYASRLQPIAANNPEVVR